MNIRVVKHLGLLTGMLTVVSLEAMQHPLSTIEKMLVTTAIRQRGLAAVRSEIDSAKDPEDIQSGRRFGVRFFTALNIEMTFKKEDNEKDPLTKAIFDKIQEIETESDYRPESIRTETGDGIFVTPATNFLTKGSVDTRYYWLEDNGARLPAVKVHAKLTNKDALQEFVKTYTE